MYRGFNLTDLNFSPGFVKQFAALGEDLHTKHQNTVMKTIEPFVTPDGTIDGSALQQNWFPMLNADVFISHSHEDKPLAMAIAGWLSQAFNIRPFVDSSVWGCAADLLKIFDDRYCWNEERRIYIYERRNDSTSHVHMMLSTALGMMIDSTECLLFLNTAQSITPRDTVMQTRSPWLFAEIAMARTIRRHNPRQPELLTEFSERIAANKSRIPVTYDLTTALSALTQIDISTLAAWNEQCKSDGRHALDVLYDIAP